MMARKLYRYLKEAFFCLKIGADLQSKFRLLHSIYLLHLHNFQKEKVEDRSLAAIPYRISLRTGVHTVWMRPGSGDIFIFLEVFFLKCYEVMDSKQAVSQIVDLGANIGLTSLFFLEKWPQAKCLCVEPNPNNIVLLKKNLEKFNDQITIVEGAIDASSGLKKFNTEGWSYGGKLGEAGDFSVACFTMAELCERGRLTRIHVLKMDIEGAEKEVFLSNLDWLKQVEHLIVELHGSLSKADVFNIIAEMGFSDLLPHERNADFVVAKIRGA